MNKLKLEEIRNEIEKTRLSNHYSEQPEYYYPTPDCIVQIIDAILEER